MRAGAMLIVLLGIWNVQEIMASTAIPCHFSEPSVYELQPVSLYCKFDHDILGEEFYLQLLRVKKSDHESEELEMVFCPKNWTNVSSCKLNPGFQLDLSYIRKMNQLRFFIRRAEKGLEGNYSCQLPPHDTNDVKECFLEVKEIPFRTRCVSPSVPAHEATNITCYFNKNLNSSLTEFLIYKTHLYSRQRVEDAVLDCHWYVENQKHNLLCETKDSSYVMDQNEVSTSVTLQVPRLTTGQVGKYICGVHSSFETDITSCSLFIRPRRENTTTQPSGKDASGSGVVEGDITCIIIGVIATLLMTAVEDEV